MTYKRLDKIFGWIVFAIAAVVYLSTIEPTVSFWDCGEFISSSFKLEVGHPPGAPTFMLIGRVASLFTSNPANIAKIINGISALASAFTIMFLFWTISYFARRIISPDGKVTREKGIAIIGASIVGALAYTFSDTFWFSAVEGEVYATSSLFTALVFWAMIRWEQAIDTKHALRWIVLIALLVGLSVGVHLLNLLAIPAMVLVYYFKKYKPSPRGVIVSLATSGIILLAVMYGIVPGVAKVAFQFELLFTNVFGLSYYTGVFVWILLLLISLVGSIYFTQFKPKKELAVTCIILGTTLLGLPFMANSAIISIILIIAIGIISWLIFDKNKALLNTIMVLFATILIGYSTFSIIVIRSLADPPMDQNNPDNAYSLLSYLNREQYGDRPLFYGEYYNSELDKRAPYIDGKPIYHKKNGKYEIVGHKPVRQFKDSDLTIFPRMYSSQPNHVEAYKQLAGIKGDRMPTFGQNMKYFVDYQLNWMYWRYFMWNFAGRQNDIQGQGNTIHGNWISGIPMFDNSRVGDMSKLPDHLKNKAHNKYYMLPLLLGIIGLIFQFSKNKKDGWIVLLLFFMTGIAIVMYLNQSPLQPRERDYAYAGSFYAFCIWIGLGTLGVYSLLKRVMKGMPAGVIATIITLLIPIQMAAQNWDDHDRSNRYVAHDFAYNYLNSCAPNAILFTYGDNDTFPIWYAQEVEGIRTDVKVCCLPYFASNWYIDQMKMASYEAKPLPLSIKEPSYQPSKRDIIYLSQDPAFKGYQPIRKVVDYLADDNKSTIKYGGDTYNTYPTSKLILPVDSANAVNSGIVKPEDAHLMASEIRWDFKENHLMKNQMMFLDLLASFNWERPIYFTSINSSNTLKLDDYFQLDGFAYRFTPIKSATPRIDTELLYENMMEKFKYGNIDDPGIYADFTIRRTTKIVRLRQNFIKLAYQLYSEGDRERAIKVLNRAEEQVPMDVFTPDYFSTDLAEAWYNFKENDRGDAVLTKIANVNEQELNYFFSLNPRLIQRNYRDTGIAIQTLQECYRMAIKYKREEITTQFQLSLSEYAPKFEDAF